MQCYDKTEIVKIEKAMREVRNEKAIVQHGDSLYNKVKGFIAGTKRYNLRLTFDIIAFLRHLPNASHYMVAKIRTCPMYKKYLAEKYGIIKKDEK